LVISTDWISWDNLNRGFLPSDEVSRAFLASFILVFDLLIVMQDWEFPHFMGDLDMNLPGLSTTQLKIKLPVCKRIFKDEYHIHITARLLMAILGIDDRSLEAWEMAFLLNRL
ncbi:hypothetical protein cypCar_00041445, partial [Cyprinus carpio]